MGGGGGEGGGKRSGISFPYPVCYEMPFDFKMNEIFNKVRSHLLLL